MSYNLANIVYKRTYARAKPDGFKEEWGETVDRVIAGNIRGHNVSQDELERLQYFMRNKKAGPAGRGLWFSGAPVHEQLGGVALNNCFQGDETFLTRQGEVSFQDSEGQEVEVLCSDGRWRKAKVKSFGRQQLQKVTFRPGRRTNQTFTHVCTPEHRWLTKNRGEVTNLREGDVVPSSIPKGFGGPAYDAGFVHGLFFADGTKHPQYPDRKIIRLCGDKAKFADILLNHPDFRTVSVHKDGDQIITLVNGKDYKTFPNENVDYMSGFLRGWVALDGSSRGRLSSQHPGAKDWLEKYAAVCGFILAGFTTDDRPTNFGKRSYPCVTFTLKQSCEFYVTGVEPTDAVEEVFCVIEPVTKSFTLSSGILTGNCWFVTADNWENFVMAQDLLMLGGGVGMSVEHRFTSCLPHVKPDVEIRHKRTTDADFIVPDSREGWCRLLYRVLESFFVTGESFSYSTLCLRGRDEPIRGFGGQASGPGPLINFVEKICKLLKRRGGKHIRPIDAMDLLCMTGEMVVSGNVRRSAIIIIGDPWDREYLTSKRWDLKPIPTERAFANLSVVCSDIEDLHPSFWKTYEAGEPFGIVNRKNIQKFGRMGEKKPDTAIGVNPCAEATLEHGEPCNLQEIFLPKLSGVDEFKEAARLMHRWGKRVCTEHYHHAVTEEVIKRNARVGTGITGCLQATNLFNPEVLDIAYHTIQDENLKSSAEYGLPESIRTTVVKPSGTMSLIGDCTAGIHPSFSEFYIRRVRFATSDPLIPLLRDAGHPIEYVQRFDGSSDPTTSVVSFYKRTPAGTPTADNFTTWQQLDTLLMAQKHWADQAVSVTVYYEREEIPKVKEWIANNLDKIKTISFLCKSDHGFAQAPLEGITQEKYEKAISKIKRVDTSSIQDSSIIPDLECKGGSCPTR